MEYVISITKEELIDISGGTKVSLNNNLETLEGECVVDTYTAGLGAYTGSIVASSVEEAKRIAFAINTAGFLLLQGKQTNRQTLSAFVREWKE